MKTSDMMFVPRFKNIRNSFLPKTLKRLGLKLIFTRISPSAQHGDAMYWVRNSGDSMNAALGSIEDTTERKRLDVVAGVVDSKDQNAVFLATV